ncbi:MAG: tyrosine-type recombinase/integrase [Neisseriaceae bacterium]|nr:tyrosine-type recombinase/integrase [Neisseriaceae bacterium]
MLSKNIKKRLLQSVEKYLLQLSCENYSQKTIESYRYDLNLFVSLLEQSNKIATFKQAVNEQCLIDTISLRYEKNPQITPFTIRRYACAYRSWINFLIDNKTLPPEFGRFRFNLPKLPQILPKSLPMVLIHSLLKQTIDKQNTMISFRNGCIFELMALSGLRIGEVVNLRLTDLSLSQRQIKVVGKGQKQRIVPISTQTAERIGQYLSLRNKKQWQYDYLFLSNCGNPLHPSVVRRALRKVTKNMQLSQRITPHMLRHSCATHFVKQTHDIRFVQILLGHTDISTTQAYAHLDTEHIGKMFDKYNATIKQSDD